MSERAPCILVVDDEPAIRRLIRRCLEPEGFRVVEAGSAASAKASLAEPTRYDLVTLDLTLPDGDGTDVARAIKARCDLPIIMVTGKGDVIDRVVGLEVGADDYIAKPFHVRELLARVRAVLRRAGGTGRTDGKGAPNAVIGVGDMRLDPELRELRDARGEPLALTTTEFDLLHALVEAKGRPLTRDALMDRLRGHEWSAFDRSIDNAVARLRKKLPRNAIRTVRGLGYQIGLPVTRPRG